MNTRRPKEWIAAFAYSTGTILMALATTLFLSNWTGAGLIHPHDPVFGLPLPVFFWIVGGVQLAAGLFCLFGSNRFFQFTVVLWLAVNLSLYYFALPYSGVTAGFKGYLGDFADAFGISCGLAELLLKVMVLYLLIGSSLALAWQWALQRHALANPSAKLSCPQCGGHLEFLLRNLGQQIPCPHCAVPITLRKPDETLKTSCYFCKKHIEFPAHALGRKTRCPHCRMDITLKQP